MSADQSSPHPFHILYHCVQISAPSVVNFYTDILGFCHLSTVFSPDAQCQSYILGASSNSSHSTRLVLEYRLPNSNTPQERLQHPGYWKINCTLNHLDLAVQRLKAKGIAVSDPSQFLDIGYLSHLKDPDGNLIELLQKDFEKDHEADQVEEVPAQPLGQWFTFAHISLRVKALQPSLAFYQDQLNMRLLAQMDAPVHRFSLYFLGYTDEKAPSPDLNAVKNRPWLWRRPYTLIELQHYWGTETDPHFQYQFPLPGTLGFSRIVLNHPKVTSSIRDPDGCLWVAHL